MAQKDLKYIDETHNLKDHYSLIWKIITNTGPPYLAVQKSRSKYKCFIFHMNMKHIFSF